MSSRSRMITAFGSIAGKSQVCNMVEIGRLEEMRLVEARDVPKTNYQMEESPQMIWALAGYPSYG